MFSPPFFYPLTGPPTLGTPSAQRAVCEIKPNCSWQFTPKEGVRAGGEKLACFSGVFHQKGMCTFGRKIVLGKVPQPSQHTGIVPGPSLCYTPGTQGQRNHIPLPRFFPNDTLINHHRVSSLQSLVYEFLRSREMNDVPNGHKEQLGAQLYSLGRCFVCSLEV